MCQGTAAAKPRKLGMPFASISVNLIREGLFPRNQESDA